MHPPQKGPPKSHILCQALLLFVLGAALAGCPKARPGWPRSTRDDPRTYIILFDIGQADCMLVVHRGRAMMVDAGATWTREARHNFRDIPLKLEQLTGRRHLDYFVVSHYHQDHIGLHGVGPRAGVGDLGLWGLINDYDITVDTIVDRGFMVIGKKIATQKHYEKAVIGWLRQGKIKRRKKVKAGDLLDMGRDLKVEVVAADGNGHLLRMVQLMPDFFKRFAPSENDYSIVLKITKGDFELSTGGDISGFNVTRYFSPDASMSYNDIESIIAADIGDIEVYHVNHHGSKNSSNPCFLRVLHPEVSLFSTGMNRYGHPNLRVYNALRKMGRAYITGGADPKIYDQVKADIIEKDIKVLVSADGSRYWVNGQPFRSLTEAQERKRPDYLATCKPKEKTLTKKDYKHIQGGEMEND